LAEAILARESKASHEPRLLSVPSINEMFLWLHAPRGARVYRHGEGHTPTSWKEFQSFYRD
jgi:hypothetical protein